MSPPRSVSASAVSARWMQHGTTPHVGARYWRVLGQVALVLEEFAGRSYAKTSPVHHFWHTFDVAVTRFSDRRVPVCRTPPTW